MTLDSAFCLSFVCSFLARWSRSLCLNTPETPFQDLCSISEKSLFCWAEVCFPCSDSPLEPSNTSLLPLPKDRLPSRSWKTAGFPALLPPPFLQPLPRRQGFDSVHHPLNSFQLTYGPCGGRSAEPDSPDVVC